MTSHVIPAPQVLIIDDEPDSQRALRGQLSQDVKTSVVHPQFLTLDELFNADLVLVDFRLEDWQDRDNIGTPSLQPSNGLALAAVLRAHVERNDLDFVTERRPTAFALHSAHLKNLSAGLPLDAREHVIARANNLEWAFQKANSETSEEVFSRQLASLAGAVSALPHSWRLDDIKGVVSTVERLLALPTEASWTARAWADVESCHPPIYELSKASHGLAFLRWFLHRILPYPCFLQDSQYLAARLRVKPKSLYTALDEMRFAELFESCRYNGLLSNFLGARWWRAGVESLVWDLSAGDPFEPEAIRRGLVDRSGISLEPSEQADPIICLDHDYHPLPDFFSVEEAVRIQPDDWPPFAQDAWATIGDALKNSMLRSIVIAADRERLDIEAPNELLAEA